MWGRPAGQLASAPQHRSLRCWWGAARRRFLVGALPDATLLASAADVVLLWHTPRLEADMTMLMSFGDGKERDEAQTQVLLEAAGFRMGRLVPTTGVMSIIEAMPVAGGKAKVL